MKSKLLKFSFLGASVMLMIVGSCKKDAQPLVNNHVGQEFDLVWPDYFPNPHYTFEHNKLTKAGFELGKKIFFENALSITNNINCGTCHQPETAFSQLGHDISHGVYARLGTRNSPGLFNLMWQQSFFWDGGANHIEVQPIAPILNHDELGETLPNVIKKLNDKPEYVKAFKAVFGKDSVDTDGVMKALAQYMSTLISDNSKYDQIKKNRPGVAFTATEERGYKLFKQHCNTCHTEPLFTDNSFRNNGLALKLNTKGEIDLGRGLITPFDSSSYYKFKVPSLRNLKYTYPYMHDGRYENLNIVLEHYKRAVQQTPNLDPLLSNGIPLTDDEKNDLIAFLNTLNDDEFVQNPIFRLAE